MPHLDGDLCFQEMRRRQPDVRVILSSGYNELQLVDRLASKGLAGFIKKPYLFDTLRDRLMEVLG